MKVSIGSQIKEGPWGGGNAFVVNLSEFLKRKGHEVFYDLKEQDIDIIIMTDPRTNSEGSSFDHKDIKRYLKYVNYQALVFHRVNECDQRKNTSNVNEFYIEANKVADSTIFVSSWLQNLYKDEGMSQTRNKVILGGANTKIFNNKGIVKWNESSPLRIVTHHWGANWNKGFQIYKKLDERLANGEFKNKYKFTYIGNLPKSFKFINSQHIPPLSGVALSSELKKHHLYITASLNEPSGNHHIEAAQCGLPLLYIESGGIPEHCNGYGVPFNEINFFEKLNEVSQDYFSHQKKIINYPLNADLMSKNYLDYFYRLLSEKEKIIADRSYLPTDNKIYKSAYYIVLYLKKVLVNNKIYRKVIHAFTKE
tara:strand:+ start:7178 stop:8275 length:1098 start_codon:yes stop_codon:yes gene_type:complete